MLSKKIGIDLGTSTVLIYVRGEGIVVNEPRLDAGRTCGSSRGPTSLLAPRRAPNVWITRPTRAGEAGAYGPIVFI